MKDKIKEFELVLKQLSELNFTNSINDFEIKPSESKWSKKEILGHLIDSAINNIKRFTEIQYFDKPYKIKQYNPDELVKSNDYQNKNNQDLYDLWMQLNYHILHLANLQTETTLAYPLILPNGKLSDLQFLINDYFEHFYYHLKQINTKNGFNFRN
jgi:hypothetical protein